MYVFDSNFEPYDNDYFLNDYENKIIELIECFDKKI